jgi:hypothetical protein
MSSDRVRLIADGDERVSDQARERLQRIDHDSVTLILDGRILTYDSPSIAREYPETRPGRHGPGSPPIALADPAFEEWREWRETVLPLNMARGAAVVAPARFFSKLGSLGSGSDG